ncbi:MAG: hypothetical protein JWN85_4083 [Gammaproteobacteria bacterium]|nr:hypothetical protein [Gammaproteobacteria bacterium]
MNVHKMIDGQFDDTDAALEHDFDAGWFGGVGILTAGDLIVAGYSEGWLSEDGSNRIGLIDRRTGGVRGQIEMPLTGPGTRQLRAACAPFPVPFVSPAEPAQIPAGQAFLSDVDPADFGCWPDPEGLALARGSDGKTYLSPVMPGLRTCRSWISVPRLPATASSKLPGAFRCRPGLLASVPAPMANTSR